MLLKQAVSFLFITSVFCSVFVLYFASTKKNLVRVASPILTSDAIDSMSDADPKLVKLIARDYLVHPSNLPYVFPSKYQLTDGQSVVVNSILKGKTHGVFVEAGAGKGFSMSNTMYLEKNKMWTGLLVEPDRSRFQMLLKVHRKAIATNSCLSVHRHPEKVTLQSDPKGIISPKVFDQSNVDYEATKALDSFTEVQCFPLQTLLWAANITTVDYLSLDMEGLELEVLKHFLWDAFDVKVLSVEFKHIPGGAPALQSFMKSKKYFVVREITDFSNEVVDLIFVHENLLDSINVPEIRDMQIPIDRREPGGWRK